MSDIDPFAGERLKLSHFHPRQEALNIRDAWSAWNGYKFADYYYDAEYEYFCVRNLCGTYDICPMQKYGIEGPDAEAMLNRMVTRDVAKIGLDRVGYALWCTDAGRLIDECGLKGHVHGAAEIFHKHANIIVNLGGATAAEVLALIDLARSTVARETGYELETEICFVGEF